MATKRTIRMVVARTALAFGLVLVSGALPVAPGHVSQVVAQDEESPDQEPSDAPTESPGGAPASEGTSAPAGPAPVFSPSGSGAGTPASGAGSSSAGSQPTGSGQSQPSTGQAGLPPLGAVTYENALKDEKVFKAGRCFGGLGIGHYVGEGFRMRLSGRCNLLLDESEMSVEAGGVTVGDGEVALEFKTYEGGPRARIGLYVRGVNEQAIGAHLQPARGEASLFAVNGAETTDLGYRNNVVAPINSWNRLALRVYGHNVWLLVNDEPILHSRDVHADAGKVFIEFIRDGDIEEAEETAVVFRNLTLTALEGGEPNRAPRGP